jgi:hypothetical protein
MRTFKILIGGIFLVSLVTEAQVVIRPGLYEFTVDMSGGVPPEATKSVLEEAGLNKQKKRDCLTPEMVRGDASQVFAREMEEANCKMSDVKTTGNKLTFTTTCEEDGMRMVGTNEMTFGPDSISGVTRMKDHEGRVTTMKMRAKRVGECSK